MCSVRHTQQRGRTGRWDRDGQTAADYAVHLGANLQSLLDRFKSGQYVAPPVRRVHIPKGDGRKTRPIGIPTFEDKVLQRAVVLVLESVYEQDFRDCSFGFRPGRSAHQAPAASLGADDGDGRGGWVIDLDIQGFSRSWTTAISVAFWTGGYATACCAERLTSGSRRVCWRTGGSAGPSSAPRKVGWCRRCWRHLPPPCDSMCGSRRRCNRVSVAEASSSAMRTTWSLSSSRNLTPTAWMCCETPRALWSHDAPGEESSGPVRRPRRGWRPGQDGDRFPPPGTFDVLGFTHYWGLSRTGSWVLKRKTAKDRLRRTLTAMNRWCGVHRHASVAEQHRMLVSKLRGHCAYYGITGNASSLSTCSFHVVHIWQKWLNRRSQKKSMPWKRFLRLLARYPLPRMTAIHSAARA